MDLLTFLTRLSIFLSYSTFVIILDFNLPMNNLCNILSLPFFHLLSSKDHFPPYFRAPFTWITKVTALPPASQLQTPCSLAIISSRPPPQLSYYNSANIPLLSTHCEPYRFSSYPSSTLISSFLSSVQFSSVTQSCLILCNPMDCSMPGLPVHHQLPEFTHTQVHWVSDAIQPFHPLSSPSPFQMSQLFASGGQSTGISASASVILMNI